MIPNQLEEVMRERTLLDTTYETVIKEERISQDPHVDLADNTHESDAMLSESRSTRGRKGANGLAQRIAFVHSIYELFDHKCDTGSTNRFAKV